MELLNKGPVTILIVEEERIVAIDIAGSLQSVENEVSGIVASGRVAIELAWFTGLIFIGSFHAC
jgi:predicted RNA-binding protein